MKSTTSYSDKVKTAKELIQTAEAVVVGIGSGLSAASGLDYGKPELVQKWYPEYYRLGCRSLMEILSLYWPNTVTEENATKYWGVWARHILHIRYETEPTEPYKNLAKLLSDKNYFVITTNGDGQTEKALSKDKIFALQGNYSQLQCKKPCCDEVFDCEIMVRQMVANMPDEFNIRGEDIPRCPKCGGLLMPNLRCDSAFVETPNLQAMPDYERFLAENQNKNLVLLELGVGFNTPSIIRYPFEAMTNEFPNTKLIRINNTYPDVPSEIKDKSVVIGECLNKVMKDLLDPQG